MNKTTADCSYQQFGVGNFSLSQERVELIIFLYSQQEQRQQQQHVSNYCSKISVVYELYRSAFMLGDSQQYFVI